jgi:hypothetical protein
MRKDVYEYVKAKPILQKFLREQPYWYRHLSRNPSDITKLEGAALNYYKQTFPDKVEKVAYSLEMAAMMLSMMQAMRKSD